MNSSTSRPTAHVGSFTVGDWLVDPRECRVFRGDTVEKLRPQLVDLLICLAKRPGAIVLRDEILNEVWQGQFIAESGLSRCVAELRQVLQDDAQQPRIIETILKRGYRVIAPVVWLERAARADAAPDQCEPIGSGPDHPEASASQPAATPATAGTVRRSAWRVRVSMGVVLAAVVIGLVAVALMPRIPARVLTDKDTVLLADVHNTTRDRVFDDTLRLALAVNLEQAPFVRLLPQEAARAALVRMGRAPDDRVVGPLALDVCRREGATVLLAGSIAPVGSRYAVGVEAIACDSGEALGRALEEVDRKEQVLGALDRGATQIRRKLGESRGSLQRHDVPLVRATTPSLEALRALTLGDDHRDHARLGDAIALYRQATELDPAFALAWARRGAAARNFGLNEEAVPALRRAYELRDRVSQPERFYIEGHYYRLVAGNPLKALEVYQAWKEVYPGSPVPPTNLASIYSDTMGQYDAALIEAREAVRLARYSSLAYSNLVEACLGSGRMAEARQAIAEAMSRGIGDRFIHRHLLNLALFDGDRAALEQEIRWASGDPLTALLSLRLRASAAMAGGRLREARRLWPETLAKAGEIGPAKRVADIRTYQAEAEALVGDARAARIAVDAALAADAGTATLLSSASALALVGDSARASAILDDVSRQAAPDQTELLVWLQVAQALVESSLGHGDMASRILQPVARFERGGEFGLVPLGARGLVEFSARRSKDAAGAFEEVIRLRAVAPATPWVAFARLGLARAVRESGDTVRSLAAYDAFLESWKDADPDAPLLAVARRERAALARR
ncbi:MAG TPA: winged helix-turn-helix domain-containing protein [Vicinamibacterales bacterium]|jgi:DNA-binding winged helix-turn-helix (wHTH) protein/tetratricopeptide (TPR) repeat protein